MSQRPLEAGMTGSAPIATARLPRAHYARLRVMAAEQGLTVGALMRRLIAEAVQQGEDLHEMRDGQGSTTLTVRDARAGDAAHRSSVPGRTSPCPTIAVPAKPVTS
jgi:hypothetical protein